MRSVVIFCALTLPLVVDARAHAQSRVRTARANETYVLIDGPATAMLEMQVGSEFRKVCIAPCDRPFPIGQTYRVAGEDVHTSEPFVLQGSTGSTTTLHVDDTRHHTGSLVTQGGVLVTIVGGLVLMGGVFGSCTEDSSACSEYRWLTVTGGALATIGVATIITGIVLMSKGSSSVIDQSQAQPPVTPPPKPQNQAFLPDFVQSGPALPTPQSQPIFSFSF